MHDCPALLRIHRSSVQLVVALFPLVVWMTGLSKFGQDGATIRELGAPGFLLAWHIVGASFSCAGCRRASRCDLCRFCSAVVASAAGVCSAVLCNSRDALVHAAEGEPGLLSMKPILV